MRYLVVACLISTLVVDIGAVPTINGIVSPQDKVTPAGSARVASQFTKIVTLGNPVNIKEQLYYINAVSDAEQDVVTPTPLDSGVTACAEPNFQGCCLVTGDVNANTCYNLPDFAIDQISSWSWPAGTHSDCVLFVDAGCQGNSLVLTNPTTNDLGGFDDTISSFACDP